MRIAITKRLRIMTRILEDDNNNFVFMKLELLICKFVLFLNIQRIQSNND